MRKQYHFQKSERGLLAWDVNRLIELTKGMEPRTVPISAIKEIDEPYWYDSDGSLPTCRDLIAHMKLAIASDLQYPIILSPEGRVMDGMHRVAKALLQDQSEIMAVRLLVLPEPDYVGVGPKDLPYENT